MLFDQLYSMLWVYGAVCSSMRRTTALTTDISQLRGQPAALSANVWVRGIGAVDDIIKDAKLLPCVW